LDILASQQLASAAPPRDGLPTPVRYVAMATVLSGIAMSSLDGTVMNLALPAIAHDLNVGAAKVIWVVNAYQIAILALLLPLAKMGDLFGYKKVYLAGVGLFTVASLACVLSRTLPQLCVARALQGIGAAGTFAMNTALVRAIYPMRQLGRGIALNSAIVAISSVAGPSVAALALSLASWPWLFAVNLPLGVLVLVLGKQSLPRRELGGSMDQERFSISDAALNAATFTLVFLGVDRLVPREAQISGPSISVSGVVLIAAGAAVGAWYVHRQRRLTVPLLPIDLLRIPMFRLSICTSVASFAGQMLASIALPFLLLRSLERTPAEAGLVLTSWPVATVLVAPLIGRLIGRVPGGLLAGLGLIAMTVGLTLMALVPPHPSMLDLAWRLALCGAGFGFFQSPNNHALITSAPVARSGAAGGMLGTARLTGQSLGAVMIGMLFSVSVLPQAQVPTVALGLAALCTLSASVASLLRLRVRQHR
jgi:DHA2 family multidrug resistance protein-like MFS transporter